MLLFESILLLSGCKEMDKIFKNNKFLKKNIHYSAQSICEIKIRCLFLQATISET